jgi:hypothetical protein
MRRSFRPASLVLMLLVLVGCRAGGSAGPVEAQPMNESTPNFVRGSLVVLNDNGGWCWFEDERAIVHAGYVIAGTVATPQGSGGDTRGGDIDLVSHHLASGKTHRVVLQEKLQADDHNSPALYVRRDGRILAMWAKHGNDGISRSAISVRPNDPTEFGPRREFVPDPKTGYCYQNVYRLDAEGGRVYNFYRGTGFNPNYMVSDDDGDTWRYGGRFLSWPKPVNDPKYTGHDGARPYPRYASNGRDEIHVIVTEDHPRAYDNSLYHGIVRGGKVRHSDGTVIGDLSTTQESSIKPNDLTRIFEGHANAVAWGSMIRLDARGLPYVAFSVQVNDADVRNDPRAGGEDIHYYYGRYDGSKWNVHKLAYGGHRLYSPEVDYSGLVALHPYDPDVVFISTSSNPSTGEPLISSADGQRHYEIFRGNTTDGGQTWRWTAITANSTVDNIRPIVPPGDPSRNIVLWMRGTYTSYVNYDLDVVGLIDVPVK